MEKRRVRLEINGVVCGLITQESDGYMQALAQEVGDLMNGILRASPYITREAAALTAALSYCDDAKKNGQKRRQLQDRVDELEVEAELWQEEKADMIKNGPNPETRARMENLERRNAALQEIAGEVDELRRQVHALEKEKGALKALEEEARQLREENRRLRQAGEPPQETEDLLAELEKLAAENAALRRGAEEQARRAEQERQASGVPGEEPPAGEEAKPKAKQPRRRKNPLRHEEEYEQEGFVSFFEKK